MVAPAGRRSSNARIVERASPFVSLAPMSAVLLVRRSPYPEKGQGAIHARFAGWSPSLAPTAAGRYTEAMADSYTFRSVAHSDLELLRRWRERPHVTQWWGAPDLEPEAEKLAEGRVAMWIVEHLGRPIAYVQDYPVHAWENHPLAPLPPGSRGIDQYIGEPEMLGLGHGSAFVRAHCERLFEAGAPAVGTDPHPDNGRAIRAYEKSGFRAVSGPVDTRWGRAILMEKRR
ncbi:MAG TPA: GNAT family N-acetyltransferase [Allosphingosinicella sp.]|jgi:aminoglycoside 6'-N-acetyltransferase